MMRASPSERGTLLVEQGFDATRPVRFCGRERIRRYVLRLALAHLRPQPIEDNLPQTAEQARPVAPIPTRMRVFAAFIARDDVFPRARSRAGDTRQLADARVLRQTR